MDTTVSGERATPQRDPVRVELWIPNGKHDEFEPVIQRLDEVAERGTVETYDVETWNRFIDLSGELTPRESRIRERLSSYARWAATHGEELSGLGDPVVRGVGRMGPERVTRRTPRAVMAEYEDGILTHVTACEECVGALRSRLHALDSAVEPASSSEPLRLKW
ncbi:hypothetical protein C440_15264 [Haloferax mucosum ATCC BAA-1512]|uniref:Uncharacterized protein n=1 Tax=Haloferax mucosum ATCC BAA-1512 TaxID=662479 RepID=M0I4I2_9EURY|nr:HTH domain-containing protein [Haloferax mucosum]ELZ91685.1 hypothetical protein C440_15264 [Haloferax mucosum ATCC BAA-1512]